MEAASAEPTILEVVVAFILKILGPIIGLWNKLRGQKHKGRLIIVALPKACHFQVSTSSRSQFMGDVILVVSNLSEYNAEFVNAVLRVRQWTRLNWVQRRKIDTVSQIWGQDPIRVRERGTLFMHFTFEDCKYDNRFPAFGTISLTDALGAKHRVKVRLFPWAKSSAENRLNQKEMPALELQASLETRMERELVSILHDELILYRDNSRRKGKLGSLGKLTQPVTSSANVVAAIALRTSQQDPKELTRFDDCLRKRLSASSVYAPVAYLALLILARASGIATAVEALSRVKDEDELHLSNALRALFAYAWEGESWDEQGICMLEKAAHELGSHEASAFTSMIAAERRRRLKS